jgi:hypothetical protein
VLPKPGLQRLCLGFRKNTGMRCQRRHSSQRLKVAIEMAILLNAMVQALLNAQARNPSL